MADTNEPAPSPQAFLELANEYAEAAKRLHALRRKGKPLSQAPFRLSAIHAIELYLNALLLAQGQEPKHLRRLRHDLDARVAETDNLKLSHRTREHLAKLTESKEYQATRYEPHTMASLSQLNRLLATLEEVQEKVHAIVARAGQV